jgi:hypothetical protein
VVEQVLEVIVVDAAIPAVAVVGFQFGIQKLRLKVPLNLRVETQLELQYVLLQCVLPVALKVQ